VVLMGLLGLLGSVFYSGRGGAHGGESVTASRPPHDLEDTRRQYSQSLELGGARAGVAVGGMMCRAGEGL
jgi:surface antigen